MALRNLNGDLILEQRRVRRSEGRVRLRCDALCLQVLNKVVLGIVQVKLDLVDGRDDFGCWEELLEDLLGEVGHSDGFDFA